MNNKSYNTLYVFMNGELIGKLYKSHKGSLIFIYTDSWINTPSARPISLSMPLVDREFSGDVVYNYFDNLLPDNKNIRDKIQKKFQIKTSHPFDLLANIGRDCIGAIQIVPENHEDFKKEIIARPLQHTEIAKILKGYQDYPLGMVNIEDDFRISIAGAQEKTAFLYEQGQWCLPLSTTPTTHIFKLPIGFINNFRQQMDLTDSCENEWLCSKIAENFGIPVAPCEILYFEDVKVLSIRRFDRRKSKDNSWIVRLPQEDICQALGFSPNLKYQADGGPGIKEIMNLLLGSSAPNSNRDLFYKSQVLFWLLAAIDGHAKNFSIFIQPQGKYNLTPLYDIMSAFPLMAKKQLNENKIKMAMCLKGKKNYYNWHNMQRRYFIETAKSSKYSLQKSEKIIDEMLKKVNHVIEAVSKELPRDFPNIISDSIFEGLYKASLELK